MLAIMSFIFASSLLFSHVIVLEIFGANLFVLIAFGYELSVQLYFKFDFFIGKTVVLDLLSLVCSFSVLPLIMMNPSLVVFSEHSLII